MKHISVALVTRNIVKQTLGPTLRGTRKRALVTLFPKGTIIPRECEGAAG